jgi:hypothetical protein
MGQYTLMKHISVTRGLASHYDQPINSGQCLANHYFFGRPIEKKNFFGRTFDMHIS